MVVAAGVLGAAGFAGGAVPWTQALDNVAQQQKPAATAVTGTAKPAAKAQPAANRT